MKPALYDAEGRPTHWRSGPDVFRKVDPGRELKLDILIDVRKPVRNLVTSSGQVAGAEALLQLRADVAAVQERSAEQAEERDELLADIDRLLEDPAARRRNEALEKLGGTGVVGRCRNFLSRMSDRGIRQYLDGLVRRPVL